MLDISEIAGMLADRVEDLARECYPDGKRHGGEWRAGSKGSVSVILNGARRGVFSDFERGESGDALDMVAYSMFDGDKSAALRWARAWLGIASMDEADLRRRREIAARRRAEAERLEAAEQAKKQKLAAGLWLNAKPNVIGTLGELYLKARGIDLAAWQHYPAAIRFRSDCYCHERGERFPAIVTGMFKLGASGCVAAHRTYLRTDAERGAWKADIKSPRKVLGNWPGALIPIQSGAGPRKFRDMKEGETVAFGEGLEEALSIALVRPAWRVFSVGYAGNFEKITLPRKARVVLCVNNDAPGSPADRAIKSAAAKIAGDGHTVAELHPPAEFKDWNDLLCGRARAPQLEGQENGEHQ